MAIDDACIKLTADNRSSFEQNKREMFDGMRGYHASEHSHKRDSINFLKTILTVTVGVFAAIFGSFITPEISFKYTTELAWGVVLISALVTALIVKSTNDKIHADHLVYRNFGSEYTRISLILELGEKVKTSAGMIQAKVIDPDRPIGQGKGYKKTQHIILCAGVAIVLIGIMLASVVSTIEHSG